MCVKSCIGFTGPFVLLEWCPECGECCYEEKDLEGSDGERKILWKVFITFLVGLQLQACWKYSQTAKNMFYQWERTQDMWQEHEQSGNPLDICDNILCGEAYLNLVDDGTIDEYDVRATLPPSMLFADRALLCRGYSMSVPKACHQMLFLFLFLVHF